MDHADIDSVISLAEDRSSTKNMQSIGEGIFEKALN